MAEGTDWMHNSACRETDPEIFFPVGTGPAARKDIEIAKSVCNSCDVAAACLSYALETDQQYGIWGGMTEEERSTVQRRRRRVKGCAGQVATSGAADMSVD